MDSKVINGEYGKLWKETFNFHNLLLSYPHANMLAYCHNNNMYGIISMA